MKRALFLCVIFILLFFAGTAAAVQDTLAQNIVRHRDFFVNLNGYEDCLLSDIEIIERGKLGVILLSAGGFEQHFVFDVQTMAPIYANARILSKNDRKLLIDTGIKMSEVKKLAKAALLRAAELKKIWTLSEGKPGNIITRQNPNQKTDDIAAMSTDEILKRFRAEIKGVQSAVLKKGEYENDKFS